MDRGPISSSYERGPNYYREKKYKILNVLLASRYYCSIREIKWQILISNTNNQEELSRGQDEVEVDSRKINCLVVNLIKYSIFK